MIRIENLKKVYGSVHALDGLSLEVPTGVVYGFLGPNGAGKTTTMRILSGLAKANSGRAWVLEKEIGQAGTDVRSLIGVLPEEPTFYPWMTPTEYLRDFIAPLYGLSPRDASQRAGEMLEMAGLAHTAKRRIAGFSRGMRQRLGLAQAMIHRPPVLLLDEPVSALDPAGRKEVLEMIETMHGKTTIFLSTHILADVERVCDVVGIVAQGKMITQDRREALLERYVTPLFEIETDNGFGQWIEKTRQLSFVENISVSNHTARVLVKDIARAQKELLVSLAGEDIQVRRFELVHPSLEDVFLRLTN